MTLSCLTLNRSPGMLLTEMMLSPIGNQRAYMTKEVFKLIFLKHNTIVIIQSQLTIIILLSEKLWQLQKSSVFEKLLKKLRNYLFPQLVLLSQELLAWPQFSVSSHLDIQLLSFSSFSGSAWVSAVPSAYFEEDHSGQPTSLHSFLLDFLFLK